MKDTATLINYLTALYNLEKAQLVLSNLVQNEKNKFWPDIPMVPKVIARPHTVFKKKSWFSNIIASIIMAALLAGIAFVVLFVFGGYFLDQQGMKMGEIATVFFEVACYLGMLIFLFFVYLKIMNDRKDKKIHEQGQLAIDRENAKAIALYRQAVKLRNEKEQQSKRAQEISRHNLALLEQKLAETQAVLQKFYELDIIYVSYRGLAFVSKYLEYLKSGRCSTLKEAYNLCMPELRDEIQIKNQGVIIHKISQAVQGIGNIHTTNIMMYQALCSINENVNRIQGDFEQQRSTLNNMQQNLTALENNTQATAYFSETTAKNNQLLTDYAVYHNFALRQKRMEEGHLY